VRACYPDPHRSRLDEATVVDNSYQFHSCANRGQLPKKEQCMPKVEGAGTLEAREGKRLIL
jgi:hypothetical protein